MRKKLSLVLALLLVFGLVPKEALIKAGKSQANRRR